MGRRNNKRLKFLLFICGFMGLVALPFAASYSSATISNAASVSITDTTKALIALHLASHAVCFPGNTISGEITNNMGVPLISLEATGASISSVNLSAGETATLSFQPSQIGFYTYDGEIHARWWNGSAQIPYSIGVKVVDPADIAVTWDATLAQISVANHCGHDLTVFVGDQSAYLASGDVALFARTGDITDVTFSLGGQLNYGARTAFTYDLGEQRDYTVTIPTVLLPPSVPMPATPTGVPLTGGLPEAPPTEELPDVPQTAEPTETAPPEEQISAGDDYLPEGDTEDTEVVIEP